MWFFRVGDTPTVRDDISSGEKLGSQGDRRRTCNFVGEMELLKGKTVTITEAYESRLGNFRYRIKEDNGMYAWTDEMFQEYFCQDEEDFEASTTEEFLSFLNGIE